MGLSFDERATVVLRRGGSVVAPDTISTAAAHGGGRGFYPWRLNTQASLAVFPERVVGKAAVVETGFPLSLERGCVTPCRSVEGLCFVAVCGRRNSDMHFSNR